MTTAEYTTEISIRQSHEPVTPNWTCMPRSCPRCGARETWLSDPSYVGGRGYLRSWRCEWCGHEATAQYHEYRLFFWCFGIPRAGQLAAVKAFLNGSTEEEAIALGERRATDVARMAAAANAEAARQIADERAQEEAR